MINSIFFQILSSWEVIVAIVAIMIILPITFYITSHDKNEALKFIGIRRKKKKRKDKEANKWDEEKNNVEDRSRKGTEDRGRVRKDKGEDDDNEEDDD